MVCNLYALTLIKARIFASSAIEMGAERMHRTLIGGLEHADAAGTSYLMPRTGRPGSRSYDHLFASSMADSCLPDESLRTALG